MLEDESSVATGDSRSTAAVTRLVRYVDPALDAPVAHPAAAVSAHHEVSLDSIDFDATRPIGLDDDISRHAGRFDPA